MRSDAASRRATGADVAREAGVSRATVGFVLNATPGQTISEATRRRVLEAAGRLGYAPSAEARTLRRGRSDVVLLYLPPDLPLTSDIGTFVEQLSTAFAAAGMTLLAHPWTRRPAADVWTAVTPAAVLAWQLSDEDAVVMRRNGVQVVSSIAGGSGPLGEWASGPREDGIAQLQVDRLVRAGHHRLGYALPHDGRLAEAAVMRDEALRRACSQRGLPRPVALPAAVDEAGAAASVAAWRAQEVSGICAHDDVAGLAVLTGLRHLGLRAPDHLAVVGVGDSPAAALADPPMTVVAVDWQATARYVFEVVAAQLDGQPVPVGPDVSSLVERRTV